MKAFWKVLKRFAAPYKKYLAGSIVLNLLSAIFNIFSFALLIPILNILFKMDQTVYEFMPWEGVPTKEQLMNNFYYYVSQIIDKFGGSTALLLLGAVFGALVLIKTGCYFASSAVMIPLRTGIVRDIRVMVYNKLVSLPMGFFNKQKKGDIIARMSGDVNEIEVSIISSLDMMIKNPILIVCYFAALIYLSWELTLFTITVVPAMAWGMSAIGKKLKRQSLEAQEKWSDTMAQLDETLGGLRIIKAFIAEEKMKERFTRTANEYRASYAKVAIRQASAHPVSEFLGSVMIMIVLWFGGTLILS
ncbi:MAG: ABC transporter ATP-binding protein, partial [Bacteroidales bacterium]|nr:ABC transporter ATP-binding protein [Bacteroidales bacterium]